MFTNLHTHSHFSLLDGLSKPSQIAQRVSLLGQTACALTDHGSISGAVTFMKACKKEGVKPILGAEFYVSNTDEEKSAVSHQIILAKNIVGWYKLIQLVSKSYDNFYYKPRIDINMLKDIADDNLISFSGHLGSTLHFRSKSMSDMQSYINLMKDIFGKDNFFIEIQLVDSSNSRKAIELAKQMRELGNYTNTQCIATGDSHYTTKSDAIDQRVLLCSSIKTTLSNVYNNPNMPLKCFFTSDNFNIPSEQEIIKCGNTTVEINNTELIANMCEDYDITGPPKLPKFQCPNNTSEQEYLRKLCIDGWHKNNKEWDKGVYGDRVKHELEIINNANLAGYFLIVQDYVNWSKNQGWLIGTNRGSVGGSLVAYLLNITTIDPIKHNLIFERFYNVGRNTKGRVSLPDIDIDFPITKRKFVLQYLKEKYDNDKVCQMVTFGRIMGRGALKEVLRVNSVCDYETMNIITKDIPQEAEISDKLEETQETSILNWVLYNDPKLVSNWCTISDNGELKGEYAQHFKQAIRLEGTYKSQGKHAAGIVLSASPLDQVCPMVRDKSSSEKIAGMDLDSLESLGHVKFDILGLAALDKLMAVKDLLRYGKIL